MAKSKQEIKETVKMSVVMDTELRHRVFRIAAMDPNYGGNSSKLIVDIVREYVEKKEREEKRK